MKNIEKILSKKSKVLLIEDDEVLSRSFQKQTSTFADIVHASSLEDAKKKLQFDKFDIVFIDLNLDQTKKRLENEGLTLIRPAVNNGAVAIVLTSVEDETVKRKAADLGASHYFIKRKISEDFEGHLKALILSSDRSRINSFFKHIYKTSDFKIIDRFKEVVKGGLNFEDHIILKGPTGAGKSLLARGIHLFCGFAESDFLHISVSDFKADLAESELFGHKKGAFTGADSDKIGILEAGNDKTIFLDEIDLLSKSVQQKLLVFLGHGTYSRIGETKQRKSKVRLITATNQDLEDLISAGKFREDFYYRINKRELNIPSISERPEDIELILNDLLKESSPEILLDEQAKRHLIYNYDYPGNVRELISIVNGLKSVEGVVTLNKLPTKVFKVGSSGVSKIRIPKAMKNFIQKTGDLAQLIEYVEEEMARESLEKNNNKLTPARKELGISYDKMKNIAARLAKRSSYGGVHHV